MLDPEEYNIYWYLSCMLLLLCIILSNVVQGIVYFLVVVFQF